MPSTPLRACCLVVVIVTAGLLSACANPRHATPTLWRVDDPHAAAGENGTLFLLGSIHLGPPEGWMLPDSTLRYLDGADALVVEVDEEAESAEAHDDQVLAFALLPIGETLKQKIDPGLYTRLRERLEETGQTIMGLDQLQPWMISVVLVVNHMMAEGYDPAGGLDVGVMRRARSRDQAIIALESTEQQLSMLSGLPMEIQELMLDEALRQTEDSQVDYSNLLEAAWRRGDDEALRVILFRDLELAPDSAPYYQALFFDRNESMRLRLQEMIATGQRYFVVVGAGHLSGERGIPRALERAGYRVERESAPWWSRFSEISP